MTFKHWWGELHWAIEEDIAARAWARKRQIKRWKRVNRTRVKWCYKIWAAINRPRKPRRPAVHRTRVPVDLGMGFVELAMARAVGQKSPLDILMEKEESGLLI